MVKNIGLELALQKIVAHPHPGSKNGMLLGFPGRPRVNIVSCRLTALLRILKTDMYSELGSD